MAELYKSRWSIELFLKWVKQHLNIKKFYSHSEQGVHHQVYIAMIVYCLNVLAQLNTNSSRTHLQISRWLKEAPWKPACTWIQKIKGSAVPQGFIISVALIKGYSKKWMFTTSV